MEATDNVFLVAHPCALCKNLTDLREPCCCSENSSDMVEVTEARLLRRCNISRGERLCQMHYDKLKSGLIFGVGSTGCCAPFHIQLSAPSHLRPVPRSWRHFFDNSAIRERYLPSLQICNQCYKITLELVLSGDENDSHSNWSASDTSSISDKYTSPRRWMSSISLHTNGSTTSDNSMFSSTSQLSTPPSSNILSLYESHREKLGHPRAVPDSIKRFFKYSTMPNSDVNRKTPLRHASSFTLKGESGLEQKDKDNTSTKNGAASSLTKLSSSASLPLPDVSVSDDIATYHSSTPKFKLNHPKSSGTNPRERRVVKQSVASPQESVLRGQKQEVSSSDTESDWESISISKLSDCENVNKEEVLGPPRFDCNDDDHSFEFLSASFIPNNEKSETRSFKPLSISIRSLANPELKVSKTRELQSPLDDSNTAKGFRFDSFGYEANKNSLNKESSNEELHDSVCSPNDANNHDSVEVNKQLSTAQSDLRKILDVSGMSHSNIVKLISLLQTSYTQVLHVFAKTLAKCVIGFALQDASRLQANKSEVEHCTKGKTSILKTADTIASLTDSDYESLLKAGVEIACFAHCQSSEIISNALETIKDFPLKNNEKFLSEFSFNTRDAQTLRLETLPKATKNLKSDTINRKTTVVWNEKTKSYHTLLTVQLKGDKGIKSSRQPRNVEDDKSFASLDSLSNSIRKSTRLPIVECYVEDIIPVSRSFSTGFLDTADHYPADHLHEFKNISRLARSSSFDSYFTLTCERTDAGETIKDCFSAVPVRILKTSKAETALLPRAQIECLSTDDGNRSASEASDTFERSSISSMESDLGSSSSEEDCTRFEAELLQHQKLTDRPHFVSHKSRIDELPKPIDPTASVPFELKPDKSSASEEKSESSAFEPITDDDASQYTEAMSTISAGTDDAQAKPPEQEAERNKTENADKVPDLIEKKHRAYDWYMGEDLERRRSSQFLKALSQATIFTKRSSKRREVRLRKTDEEPEDDDVATVIGRAMDDFCPRLLRRKTKNSDDEEETSEIETDNNRHRTKVVLRVVVIVGLVGALFYAGWKLYTRA